MASVFCLFVKYNQKYFIPIQERQA